MSKIRRCLSILLVASIYSGMLSAVASADEGILEEQAEIPYTEGADGRSEDTFEVFDIEDAAISEEIIPEEAEVSVIETEEKALVYEAGTTKPGQSSGSSTVTWSGATTITKETTTSGQSYSSTSTSQNAILIETSAPVTLYSPMVSKTGGTSAGDSESFYGTNSAIMCKGGGTTTITDATITTSASGANAVFCYGGYSTTNNLKTDGTTVIISDSTIITTGSGSGGIMTTGGGITTASNLTVTTSGGSSAAIRTDRGGGTVTVDGGTYTTKGTGSPAIYATATINVSNATLTSTASQGVVNEGGNTVILNNCTVNAGNTTRNGQDYFNNGIFLYQSRSGDASDGASVFTMKGGTLNNTCGHVFHVTNTSAAITLEEVEINNTDLQGVFLSVCDDAWSGLSNAAKVYATDQTIDGDMLVGSDSTLSLYLYGTSTWTGTTSGKITAHKSSAGSVSSTLGTVNVTMDSTSTWTLTADTYVKSLKDTGVTNYSNINLNGYTLYVDGKAITSTSWSGVPGQEEREPFADFAFSHSCSFGNDLVLNYYIPVSQVEGYTIVSLVLAKEVLADNGTTTRKETTLTKYSRSVVDKVEYYKFTYSGIAAKEMGSNVHAVLYLQKDGETYSTPEDVYNVKTYAYSRLKKSNDEYFKTLLVDLLNYGAMAQTYFGYNTANLVNQDLSSAQQALGTAATPQPVSCAETTETNGTTAQFIARSVLFDSNIKLKYYMTFDSGVVLDNVTLVLTYTTSTGVEKEARISGDDFGYEEYAEGKYAYTARLGTIAAKDIGQPVTAKLYEGDTLISNVLVYSIETYCYNRLRNSTDGTFKLLIGELMKYGRSAKAYFENS